MIWGLILLFVLSGLCMIVFIYTLLIMKKSVLKKRTLLILGMLMVAFPLIYGMFALIDNYPISSTDLSNQNINGYSLNKNLNDLELNNMVGNSKFTDSKYNIYEVENCKLILIRTLKSSAKKGMIVSIDAYNNNDDANQPKLGSLQIGESTFEQVVSIYGNSYRNLHFSEQYEKKIIYEDHKQKISLQLSFLQNVLEVVLLQRS